MQNKKIHVDLITGTIDDAVNFFNSIPEFYNPYPPEEFSKRLEHTPHLILSAVVDNTTVGMKIGYERLGNFYSWLGAVMPEFRRSGIANELAKYQEAWAEHNGYNSIYMKTRIRLHPMLQFNLKRGFKIIGFEEKDNFQESRILMKKEL